MSRRVEINSYEIKKSKLGVKIPVINGVHLHSIYNPIKEAASLMNKFELTLKNKNHILTLGLGFGYHIIEMMNNIREFWGDDFQIVVIEPSKDIVRDCLAEIEFPKNNIKIFNSDNVISLYSNQDLVDFLLKKPGVITHPSSFNLHKEFFRDFLQYSSSEYLKDILIGIENPKLKKQLQKFGENTTLKESLSNSKSKTIYAEKIEIFLEAFRVMYEEDEDKTVFKRGINV